MIRVLMRLDRTAPHPEMVREGREGLSEETNPAVDGCGLVIAEDCEETDEAASMSWSPRKIVDAD